MFRSALAQSIAALTSPRLIVAVVWGGFALLTITLLVLMRTRWGEAQPLRKCVVLSLIAHLLFAVYMTTVHIVAGPPQDGYGPAIRISTLDESADDSIEPDRRGERESPWERLADDVAPDSQPPELDPPRGDLAAESKTPSAPLPSAKTELSPPVPPPLEPAEPAAKIAAAVAPAEIDAPAAQRQVDPLIGPQPGELPRPTPDESAVLKPPLTVVPHDDASPQLAQPQLADPPSAPREEAALAGPQDVPQRRESPLRPTDPPDDIPAAADLVAVRPRVTGSPAASAQSKPADDIARRALETLGGAIGNSATGNSAATPTARDGTGAAARSGTPHVTPEVYKLRGAPDRTLVAASRGGSPQTEAAVKAALRWLAANQSPDGHWDASRFGGGRETKTLDHDRRGAGAEADTAMTGLTLLAFMAAGHTHKEGGYQPSVQRGLNYLMAVQAVDGNLAGQAETYAFMYCHGIAAMALSEAYALTGDARLANAVRRALAYTIAAQNRTTGGWRYRPGEEGDTSQLGWQLMALKSAELGGIPIPAATRDGMARFLRSVSSGQHNGLASYRPRERVSCSMTAEALVCRQFLAVDRTAALAEEAAHYVVTELPGQGKSNFYYWYYATLGLYQLQDEHWTRWNEALTTTLTRSQRRDGDLAGSWDPDDVWGGYGGRVYSTSLGALCLEVYYRYLPLYTEAATHDRALR
jgi:Squalene-hopene cyclase C-terminal domain